jgi:hypothetical protein
MKKGAIAVNREQEATGPGIVVLSSALQVLHMNRRAMDLLDHFTPAAEKLGTKPALAAPLHQHCEDIIQTLQSHLASNNWEQFHQYRVIGESNHKILLKGFGLPDRRGLPHCRILILLSPHISASSSASSLEISRMKSPGGVSERDHLGSDSPRVIAE